MRRRVVSVATLAACLSSIVFTDGAQAAPTILPGVVLASGDARLEVALPPGSRRCRVSFSGARRYGPYRLRAGGPTRFVRWRLGAGASGSWTARVVCSVSGRRSSAAVSRFAVRRGGRARGRLVAGGSVRSRPGSIPELTRPARAAADLTARAANDLEIGDGDPAKFTACPGGKWVVSTRTIGDGVGTYLRVVPTTAATQQGRGGQEQDPFYRELWDETMRCAPLTDVPGSQRHSMYLQLACHAKFHWTGLAGSDWGLEAWRQDKTWDEGLTARNRCGEGYGDIGAGIVGAYMDGRIVNSFPPGHATQRKAWLVQRQPLGFYLRRHIPTTQLYGCLLAGGKSPARWYPQNFLNDYLRIGDPFTDAECLTQPAPQPQQPQPQPPQQPQPQAPQPQPQPQPPAGPKPYAGNLIAVVYGGGHVGIAFDVGWQAGRDPVVCRTYRDGVLVAQDQCGTRSSRQFYGVPAGTHSWYATVTDRFGVVSDPTNTVTVYSN